MGLAALLTSDAGCTLVSDLDAGSAVSEDYCETSLAPRIYRYQLMGTDNSVLILEYGSNLERLDRIATATGRPVFGTWMSQTVYGNHGLEIVPIVTLKEGSIEVSSTCMHQGVSKKIQAATTAVYTDTTIEITGSASDRADF